MSNAAFMRVSLIDARSPSSAFTASPLHNARHAAALPANRGGGDDAFDRGVAEGTRVACETFDIERASMTRLIAAAQALQPEPSEELAAMIATTVERLVTELVGSAAVDRSLLDVRIASAVETITAADDARVLWLNPDDLALVDPQIIPLELRGDPDLERGALRIDCSSGWIENSHSLHLDALRTALGIGAGR